MNHNYKQKAAILHNNSEKLHQTFSSSTAQGNASLEGSEFVWKYYDGYYTKDNLPSELTRTWTTKTIAEFAGENKVEQRLEE